MIQNMQMNGMMNPAGSVTIYTNMDGKIKALYQHFANTMGVGIVMAETMPLVETKNMMAKTFMMPKC